MRCEGWDRLRVCKQSAYKLFLSVSEKSDSNWNSESLTFGLRNIPSGMMMMMKSYAAPILDETGAERSKTAQNNVFREKKR